MKTKTKTDKGSKVGVAAPKAKRVKGTAGDGFTGEALRVAVAKSVASGERIAKAKSTTKPDAKPKPKPKPKPKTVAAGPTEWETGRPSTPVAEVVDVTNEVMGVLEQQAKRIAVNVAAQAKQDAEERAAIVVYAYAERVGIDAADVVQTATDTGEMDSLVAEAGMEITDTVVWLAAQKAREFDTKYVRPNSPTSRLRNTESVDKPKASKAGGIARVQVFGHAATAVIRALRATCGMGFSQIRSVLDAMGAATVADATIRAQMTGGGLTRGEPAPLTEKQIDAAKEATGLVTA